MLNHSYKRVYFEHVPMGALTDSTAHGPRLGSTRFPLQMYGTEKCAENRLFTMWKGQMNRRDSPRAAQPLSHHVRPSARAESQLRISLSACR